jgi:two-component system, LuxR family, response regulator FixJ
VALYVQMNSMTANALISIVDDDDSIRESLEALLASLGFKVATFPSALEFLQSPLLHQSGCLIVDIRMPGMNGLELQQRLISDRCAIPMIFISAHGDHSLRALVMAHGAVAFLFKPFTEDALVGSVRAALQFAQSRKEFPWERTR